MCTSAEDRSPAGWQRLAALLTPEGPPAPAQPLLPPRDVNRFDRLWYLVLIGFVLVYIPFLFRGYFSLVIQNDATQAVSPYWAFHGTGLVENGLIREYLYQYTPLGHKAVYWVATLALTPAMASQILTLVLMAIAVGIFWKFGGSLGTAAAGAVMGILILHGSMGTSIMGALSRSFSPPIALGFLYFLLRGSERGVLAMLLLAAAFYPSLFAALLVAWLLNVTLEGIRGNRSVIVPRLVRLALVVGLGAILLLPNALKTDSVGSPITLAEAEKMPEWHAGGRFPWLPIPTLPTAMGRSFQGTFASEVAPPVAQYGAAGQAILWTFYIGWSAIGALLLIRGPGPRHIPKILAVLAGGAIMYAIAHALAFQLFAPGRMLLHTWPVTIILTLCLGLASAPTLTWHRRRIDLRVLLLAGLLVSTLACFGSGISPRHRGMVDRRHHADLYAFFRGAPNGALVAGDPVELDYVSLFAARTLYVSYEASHPLYTTYYAEVSRRLLACERAYFATRPEDVADFFRAEKIDLFLVNVNHYQADGMKRFLPFSPTGGNS